MVDAPGGSPAGLTLEQLLGAPAQPSVAAAHILIEIACAHTYTHPLRILDYIFIEVLR
jgi:hypothetical protein